MNWFQQQTRRDQMAVIICAILLSVFLVWIAIIKPLSNAADRANQSNQLTADSLVRVKSLAATLQYYQTSAAKRPRTQQISIQGAVNSSVQAAGLSFTSLVPSANGEEASVRFESANYKNIIQWLHSLENVYDIQIASLNLTAGIQPGQVSVNIRLRKK